jgi:hypothetical protein
VPALAGDAERARALDGGGGGVRPPGEQELEDLDVALLRRDEARPLKAAFLVLLFYSLSYHHDGCMQ